MLIGFDAILRAVYAQHQSSIFIGNLTRKLRLALNFLVRVYSVTPFQAEL
jgi:hypothetical protein